MCTLIAASRLRPDLPLLVAANRDEFFGRPAVGPRELSPGIFAGTDLERGGSWLGATRSGLFVGLTNQHTEHLLAVAPRSRGEIVIGALASGSVDGVLALLHGLDPTLYNPFNLLFGDAHRLFVAYSWRDTRVEPDELPPGLHVLANDALHSPLYPKTQRAEAMAAPLLSLPWPELAPALATLLGDHQKPPPPPGPLPVCDDELIPVAHQLQSLCVHTDRGYGTRSAAIIAIGPEGLARYDFADGPPCVTAFARVALRGTPLKGGAGLRPDLLRRSQALRAG